MDFWEDLGFRQYPRKVFRWILLGALTIAVLWGLVTWDTKRGTEMYFKEVEYISKPLVNYAMRRGERIGKYAEIFLGKVIENLFKPYTE